MKALDVQIVIGGEPDRVLAVVELPPGRPIHLATERQPSRRYADLASFQTMSETWRWVGPRTTQMAGDLVAIHHNIIRALCQSFPVPLAPTTATRLWSRTALAIWSCLS